MSARATLEDRRGACHAGRVTDALTARDIRVTLAGDALDDLRERLLRTRLTTADGDGRARGVPRSWLAALLADWQKFDVAAFQARLDRLTHREVTVDGQRIHLVHAPGQGPDPLPLLLTHGWPGSFCEYLDLIPLLADPAAHGGDPADAFTVVVPSLPGFGFSAAPPPGGLTAAAVAALWHRLMTGSLGYPRFAAHGSDLGAGVTAWLARDFPAAVAGIHLATPGLAVPRPGRPGAEQPGGGGIRSPRSTAWTAGEGGYAHEQSTKPVHARRRAARFPGRPGRLDRREGHRLERGQPRRPARVRPGPAAGHADPVLGHRHHHLVAAALLGLRARPRRRVAGR